MSMNTANTPDGQGILIYNGEIIHIFTPLVAFTFEKSSDQVLSGCMSGQLFLTSHRIIFRPLPVEQGLITFEMPFHAMDNVKLEQPIFGSNYLSGTVSPSPGSPFRAHIPWRVTFNKGGCVEFGLALLNAVEVATRRTRPMNAPPPYAPPAGAYFAAPPAYYLPSAPCENPAFPMRPPTQDVFMHEAPPPYPGVGEERAPMPTEELRRAGESAPLLGAPPAYDSNLRQRR